jgi:translation initiation factor 4G
LEEISLSAVPNENEDFDEDAEEDLARDSLALGSMSSRSEELEDSLSNEVNASPPRVLKTQEQIRLEIQEKVKKAVEADKAKQEKEEEEEELERQIREMERLEDEEERKRAEAEAQAGAGR